MWTKSDLVQIQSDTSVIYSSLMKEAIIERDGSFVIDLETNISAPSDIAGNMMLYSAASEIFKMCSSEYRNTVHNTCVKWIGVPVPVRHMIAIMDDMQKAVYNEANMDVAEKATVFAILVLQKDN